MAYLPLGVLILLGVIALLRTFASANSASLATAVRRTAVGSAALGVVLLLLRVPLGLMFVVLGAALPVALRWRALWPDSAASSNRPRGKRSRVDTKYLSMELDHASGTLAGRVLAGRHRDRLVAELTLEQLLEVRTECLVDDPDGVTLIEAYLDRIHGTDWRGKASARQSSESAASSRASGAMTRAEAYDVLGLAPGASDAEISAAHHRLIMKLHSDHGGSDYLAAQINQARDVLLGA